MEIYKAFQAFRYEYQDNIIKRAEEILNELDEYISDKTYVTNLQLEQVDFSFINAEAFKCRVRPQYRAKANNSIPLLYNIMTLRYEIPMPEVEFIKVSDEDRPTYIGKALMKVLESQNVPTKIRKQFDRERFIADVRDFFVNVKGCKLD